MSNSRRHGSRSVWRTMRDFRAQNSAALGSGNVSHLPRSEAKPAKDKKIMRRAGARDIPVGEVSSAQGCHKDAYFTRPAWQHSHVHPRHQCRCPRCQHLGRDHAGNRIFLRYGPRLYALQAPEADTELAENGNQLILFDI
jgi:hypothetical protein